MISDILKRVSSCSDDERGFYLYRKKSKFEALNKSILMTHKGKSLRYIL